MSSLSVFDFNSNSVRVVLVGGEPWFVAKDVYQALAISWTGAQVLNQLKDSWKQTQEIPDPNGRLQTTWLINESAVYKITFRSNKPEAESFTDLVAEEILPTIRKTGKYEITSAQPTPIINPALAASREIAEIFQNLDGISPRLAQRLTDIRMNQLERDLGFAALPPCESPLLGAVEIAEDLGYKPDSNHWSALGRCVAKAYRQAGLGEPAKEKRMLHGRMTSLMLYTSNEPVVVEAIHSFYRLKIKSA